MENNFRSDCAHIALRCHRAAQSTPADGPLPGPQEIGTLLSDLMHYCDKHELHWDECHQIGVDRYLDETGRRVP